MQNLDTTSEVLKVVNINDTVLCKVTPCVLLDMNQNVGITCCLISQYLLT
jgi:hypothetical protein